MRRIILPLILALACGGVFGWWWMQPERVVARRVTGLFQSSNVAADSGSIARGIRGGAIEGYLAPNITFEGPSGPTEQIDGLQSRDSVVAMFGGLARYCRSVVVGNPEFEDITVNGNEATVRARTDAVIELPAENRPVDGIQHLTMTWRKIDGKWLLSSAKWHETGR